MKSVWVVCVLTLQPLSAWAFVSPLPASLAHDVLSETVPTAFAGFDLESDDYVVDWEGQAPEGIVLKVLPHTVQWVRVSDVMALPRARLSVEARGVVAGRISNAGFTQALSKNPAAPSAQMTAEMPVALISGSSNPIEVAWEREAGKPQKATARLRFVPRDSIGSDRVFFDASCSRFGMTASGTAQSLKAKGWAYVGCRIAEVEASEHRTSSLEAWVYWDGVGQKILVGGVETPSSSVSLWPLRLRSEPGTIQLAVPGGGDEMTLHYGTPEYYHRGFVGIGLGPYWDHFTGNGEVVSTPAAMLTIYGSYFITEAFRVVGFDATTLDSRLTSDMGVYLSSEYARFYDRRILINLLLGGHAMGFFSRGTYYFKIGVPQGVEITFVDFLKKGCNITTGFFLYPLIAGVSYYNVWLRWGSGRIFGEFNYISWDQPIGDQAVHADSAGISVGMPLGRFL